MLYFFFCQRANSLIYGLWSKRCEYFGWMCRITFVMLMVIAACVVVIVKRPLCGSKLPAGRQSFPLRGWGRFLVLTNEEPSRRETVVSVKCGECVNPAFSYGLMGRKTSYAIWTQSSPAKSSVVLSCVWRMEISYSLYTGEELIATLGTGK